MALPNGSEPEKRLNQLSQLALTATQQELPPLAAEAFSVFQQYAATGSPPGHIFASLLCILGCAGLWDTAFRVYNLVPVKVPGPLPFQLFNNAKVIGARPLQSPHSARLSSGDRAESVIGLHSSTRLGCPANRSTESLLDSYCHWILMFL